MTVDYVLKRPRHVRADHLRCWHPELRRSQIASDESHRGANESVAPKCWGSSHLERRGDDCPLRGTVRAKQPALVAVHQLLDSPLKARFWTIDRILPGRRYQRGQAIDALDPRTRRGYYDLGSNHRFLLRCLARLDANAGRSFVRRPRSS